MVNEKKEVFVTTSNGFDGYQVIEYLGVVNKAGYFNHFISYEESFDKARTRVLDELIVEAGNLGANAIIGLNFNYASTADSVHVNYYGTAVNIEPLPESE